MGLSGKVCVITGASSGIGERTALDLAAQGARVCVAARREERLKDLIYRMGGEQRGHSWCVTDVSDREQVAALATHVRERHGRCDVLVNNAGFNLETKFVGPESIEAIESVLQTNFFGVVYCTAEFMPLLKESAPANVVNVASIAGRIAVSGAAAYCASKFAVVGLSEALHFELQDQGINVSLVEPGFIATEGFPQKDIVEDKVFRYALGSVEGVSKAIQDAVEGNKMQRVSPRWYYLLQIPRLLVPPIYRLIQFRFVKPRQISRQR